MGYDGVRFRSKLDVDRHLPYFIPSSSSLFLDEQICNRYRRIRRLVKDDSESSYLVNGGHETKIQINYT